MEESPMTAPLSMSIYWERSTAIISPTVPNVELYSVAMTGLLYSLLNGVSDNPSGGI